MARIEKIWITVKGHEACDKMNCLYFINEYLNKYEQEDVVPDNKYKERQSELKRKYENEDSQNRNMIQVNNEYTLNSQINKKIAKTWLVKKSYTKTKTRKSLTKVNWLTTYSTMSQFSKSTRPTNRNIYWIQPAIERVIGMFDYLNIHNSVGILIFVTKIWY